MDDNDTNDENKMKTDCGDVRQPSLLESGGLSGKHMLSPLKTIIMMMMMMMMMILILGAWIKVPHIKVNLFSILQ